ncbi:metallophosphoesterase [Knoellia subterranea]|uniref:Metallophosphoesterase n=1 Tax=Knoellia subterranea KCTC 19937 TaxID=1385521 RepID=A0A0A0JHA5_9MICO|nr:metallophosphoesterase [Knoellia subterranea]KGN36129.1 metallophosphoesterase [Knoellia subterranea KCTC 19937]
MPLFVLVPLALVGLLTFWLHRRLVVAPGWQTPWRYAVSAALVALTGLAVVALAGGLRWGTADDTRPVAWIGMTWLAVFWYLLLGAALTQLVALVVRLATDREKRTPVLRRWNRAAAGLTVATALGATAYGVVAAGDPTITRATHTSAALPDAFDGTTVALVTDLHAGVVHGADFARTVVDRVSAAHPDLILLSGDVVDAPFERHRAEIAPLADLEAPLGVFAVTGNHEMYTGTTAEWLAEWERLGITVLANTSTVISRDGATIRVAGVHDLEGEGEFAPDIDRALDGTADAFTLHVAHQPLVATRSANRGVDLQLSGHTHGGQVWPFNLLVPLQQPMVEGYAVIDGVPVITSRGAGTWGPPVRVGAAPEIPLITLRKA